MTTPGFHKLIRPCEFCPTPDRCLTEGSCRATWDSWVRDETNAAEKAFAEQHPCPECRAKAGDPCTNVHTGAPLGKQPAHVRRYTKARKATP